MAQQSRYEAASLQVYPQVYPQVELVSHRGAPTPCGC
nr:MAG TPA: Aldehyde dehydrogenase [Caudoviricetes sp.]